MSFMHTSSPHLSAANPVQHLMRQVLLALIPGLIALIHFFGPGVMANLFAACGFAVLCEALVLKLRGYNLHFFLSDYSALVTGALLAVSIPPYSPWWMIFIGVFFSIVVAKHLFGGLGQNPFNPAMVGYVVLLISFPVYMTHWTAPSELASTPSLLNSLASLWSHDNYDGTTMATPLDLMKQNEGQMLTFLYANNPQFGSYAGLGWEWVNLGFLAGGLWMLQQKLFTWHGPLGMLATLGILSALFYDGGSSASGGSPLFHWLSGATMLGAFFIITDPASGATSNLGRLIFGAMVGVLVYCIRVWGNYPDAVAFAVLLLNFCAPFIDYYTIPKPYGTEDSKS